MSLAGITLNGLPLEQALKSVNRNNSQRQDTEKPVEFVVSHSRPIVTRGIRNHSGSRSGKCKLIYSSSWSGGVA